MKIYTLLIIDRHCDPQVMVYRKPEPAEQEAIDRAQKFWTGFDAHRDINGLLSITCADVGEMKVQEHEL